jgi:hypothetical protein
VIARNTAFTYKGRPLDGEQVRRDLNVCYVLEGSVQRGGNRMRVNVQLIDAETGSHLWAEGFDKPVADLFETRLGLLPEACSEARTGLAINPTFSIPRFRASTASENPTAVAGRERIIDGLRKA